VRERARREPMSRSQRSHPLTEGLGHKRSIRARSRSVVLRCAFKCAAKRAAGLTLAPAACCGARQAWPKSMVLCPAFYCATDCGDAALRVSRMPRRSSAHVQLHPQLAPTAAGTPSIVPANSRERASPTPRGRSAAAEICKRHRR
jgi:hypothetical protein